MTTKAHPLLYLRIKLLLFAATILTAPAGVAYALKFDHEPYPYPYQPAFVGSPEDPPGVIKVSRTRLYVVAMDGEEEEISFKDVIPDSVGSRDWAVDQTFFILAHCFTDRACSSDQRTASFVQNQLMAIGKGEAESLRIEWRTLHFPLSGDGPIRDVLDSSVTVALSDQ